MDQNRVRELFLLLPPRSAYPATPRRSLFQPAPQEPAERFALALRDPAFGASFVGAFIEKRRWLPDTIIEWPLLQFYLSRVFKVTEPIMLEVESFRTEIRREERNILDALLLADTSFASIAEILNTREEVIEAFEVLFFNVRDRRHEKAYLNSLLYPAGWQAAIRDAKPNAEGDRLRLLRAGAVNDVDEVLALAGYKLGCKTGVLAEDCGEVERRMQQDARGRMRAGCRIEDPVVRAVHTAAVRRQEIAKTEDELAMHNINAVTPALEELRKYNSLKAVPRPDFRPEAEEVRKQARELIEALRRE